MFTGIVRERARVVAADGGADGVRLELEAPETAAGVAVGDSVSVAGVCLTVTAVAGVRMTFDIVPESVARSTLGALAAGNAVNVEPALRAGDALGGHYVQGHVDAVGSIRSATAEGDGTRIWIDAPPEVLRYCVEKGSVAVDGVSLTIAALDEDGFAVALVPHTLESTTFGTAAPGGLVNLEVDVLAKYVERLIARDTIQT